MSSKGPGPASGVSPIIDAHCHIFNGSDLPAIRFIKIAILDHYPQQEISTLDINDPDALDGLISLLAWVLGQSRAPSADDEIAVLERRRAVSAESADSNTNAAVSKQLIGQFLHPRTTATMVGTNPRPFVLIRGALLKAAGRGPLATSEAPMTEEEAQAAADKAFHSDSVIGRFLRWASLFTRYRFSLAADLLNSARSQGFSPALITPALIDYDKWLGQDVDASPLPRQVEVMSLISRAATDTPIHGYVPFDPLRAAYFRKRVDRRFDPVALVQHALSNCGFLGVKLYPPMGFKPYKNAGVEQHYPDDVVEHLSHRVGTELDTSLAAIYQTCIAFDAPILAHAGATNGAGPGYQLRADPANWLPVFERWPTLRICLAHYGSFDTISASTPQEPLPEGSWEWAFGRYISANPDAPVFTDVSYFSEILDTAEWPKYKMIVKDYLAKFDPDCRHLVYGTDWLMVGREKNSEKYTRVLYDFFRIECGLDDARLARLFSGNAVRFLGLREGDRTNLRLKTFYAKYRLPWSRINSLGLCCKEPPFINKTPPGDN